MARSAHPPGHRERDLTLSPGLRTVCGRDREDEPSLSQADRRDQKPAGLVGQSDHIACLKITWRDQFIHNLTLAGVITSVITRGNK